MPARDNGALRGYASTGQHGATADACGSVAHGTEKTVWIARDMLAGRPRKHRFHLGLQGGGVERLDDVVADPGLLRGDDVFGL
jgi:hypothetical protein